MYARRTIVRSNAQKPTAMEQCDVNVVDCLVESEEAERGQQAYEGPLVKHSADWAQMRKEEARWDVQRCVDK